MIIKGFLDVRMSQVAYCKEHYARSIIQLLPYNSHSGRGEEDRRNGNRKNKWEKYTKEKKKKYTYTHTHTHTFIMM